ncbi:gas vesicle protein GvpG [Streptomyces sp. 7N604]|uniref:gas vesicle protein GvpG n=1 Tax=Streptomyces sp. 7N604 TaxID=3457415 RepID=UPI003FD46070
MGLFTGLLTLPLAPVRGVAWIGQRIYDEARRQTTDPAVIRERLAEVSDARAAGEISEEEAARREKQLVRRLFSSGPPGPGVEA